MRFKYHSGEFVETGARVNYGAWTAKVDFVVTERSGDEAIDSYLEQFSKGGFMITTDFG